MAREIQFCGVVVPKIRRIVKAHRNAPGREVRKLLRSKFHEERLTALLILVDQYQRGDALQSREIYDLYLASTAHINNWDLVDLTAQHIVGAYLDDKDTSVLTRLALSQESLGAPHRNACHAFTSSGKGIAAKPCGLRNCCCMIHTI